MRQTSEDKAESDEINPQDGLLRSWMFYNGDWVETTFGLTAAIALVFWCFLYVLGLSQSILGYVLFAAAIVGSIGWYALYRSLSITKKRDGERAKAAPLDWKGTSFELPLHCGYLFL